MRPRPLHIDEEAHHRDNNSASDSAEIWTHSEAAELCGALPQKRSLRVNFRQGLSEPAKLRIWQENSDYEADVDGTPSARGWTTFQTELYTGLGFELDWDALKRYTVA